MHNVKKFIEFKAKLQAEKLTQKIWKWICAFTWNLSA